MDTSKENKPGRTQIRLTYFNSPYKMELIVELKGLTDDQIKELLFSSYLKMKRGCEKRHFQDTLK